MWAEEPKSTFKIFNAKTNNIVPVAHELEEIYISWGPSPVHPGSHTQLAFLSAEKTPPGGAAAASHFPLLAHGGHRTSDTCTTSDFMSSSSTATNLRKETRAETSFKILAGFRETDER